MLTCKKYSVTIADSDKEILKNINYTFEKGKIYAVMGPNGSGKSTLAQSIMGNPAYEIGKHSKIVLNNEDIQELESFERSQKGIGMTFQNPLSLQGVTVYQLMRYALQNTQDPLTIRNKVHDAAKELGIDQAMLERSLNDGFSGGERKKMEILQMMVMEPDVIFFDEIDTGVDVDAMKSIARAMKKLHTKEKTFVIITHYTRLLNLITPDVVLILKDGEIIKEGDVTLAEKIEQSGYESI